MVLNGIDDLDKNLTSSQYSFNNNGITNSKKMRFSFNNSLSDVKLSQNARCVLEACHIPNITNLTNNLVYLRLIASSNDKTFDTSKNLNGNPVILSTIVHSSSVSPNVIYNATDFFYSINVSSNFLEKGYVELELECITTTANINYITSSPLKFFYVSLIIIDEDVELTSDLTLAPPIDYNNYNVNMPIKPIRITYINGISIIDNFYF